MRALLAAVVALLLANPPALADTFMGRELIVTDGRAQAHPSALVLVLHGFTGTAAGMQSKTEFDTLAQRDGFVVAYPTGIGRRWNDGTYSRNSTDDVAYLTALISHLVSSGQADPARVFIAGHSNGGGMAMRMGCERPDLIAGIAVIAMTASATAPCANGAALPAFFFHGMQDPIVPEAGLPPSSRHGGLLSLSNSLALWSARNRCRANPDIDMPDPHTRTVYLKYRGCAAPLYLLRIAEHGHEWPGAGPRARWLQGPATSRVDAADVAWRFFNAL